MCTIANAKVRQNYNCYNVYFYECLLKAANWRFFFVFFALLFGLFGLLSYLCRQKLWNRFK